MSFEKISVIGLGYIGLPTAAMFAAKKVRVTGVDVNKKTVATINQGNIHIVEPDLDTVVHQAVIDGYLTASTQPEPADVFILAVPTPFLDNKKPDLSYIQAAATAIAPVLQKGNLVILESTSPVGTTEKLAAWIAAQRQDLIIAQKGRIEVDVHVAHCPERVLPGQIMRELIENDRIVGGITDTCTQKSVELYKLFVKGECISTDARTAELAKLTENSFRDVNIAFANELSLICADLDVDVWELIKLANRHPRVNVLKPGCGVGGHCIAVDPWFIVDSCPDNANLIRTARMVNDEKPKWVIQKIRDRLSALSFDTVICMGIAFKPDIDDLRESPALEITRSLVALGLNVKVVEPNINELPEELIEQGVELLELSDTNGLSGALKTCFVAHNHFKHFLNDQPIFKNEWLDFCGLFEG